jgi:hypothetical protein
MSFLFFPHIYIKQIDMNTKNNNDRLIINHKYYQDLSRICAPILQNEIKDLYKLSTNCSRKYKSN